MGYGRTEGNVGITARIGVTIRSGSRYEATAVSQVTLWGLIILGGVCVAGKYRAPTGWPTVAHTYSGARNAPSSFEITNFTVAPGTRGQDKVPKKIIRLATDATERRYPPSE